MKFADCELRIFHPPLPHLIRSDSKKLFVAPIQNLPMVIAWPMTSGVIHLSSPSAIYLTQLIERNSRLDSEVQYGDTYTFT